MFLSDRASLWAFASLFHAWDSRSEPFPGPHPSENPVMDHPHNHSLDRQPPGLKFLRTGPRIQNDSTPSSGAMGRKPLVKFETEPGGWRNAAG
jgi:hypothetical protein